MANTIMPTVFASGVRRLRTLNGWPMLGAMGSDVSNGMLADGYNPVIIKTLLDAGVTDAQLQNLWDNYGAGTPEFGRAATQLVASLSPSGSIFDVNPTATATSNVAFGAANAVIQTPYKVFDLSTKAAWDEISSLFVSRQQQLNALARQLPNDPDVISHVTQFNDLVNRFAGYYQQALGTAPSSIPLATLSGLGIAPLVIAGVVAGVGLLLAALYEIDKWLDAKKIQAQTDYYKTTGQLPGTNITQWFTQNATTIVFVVALLVLGPPLIKKL